MTVTPPPVPAPPLPTTATAPPRVNTVAIVALACTVVGAVAAFPALLGGLVLGIVAVGQIRRRGERGLWMAVTSIVVSTVLGIGGVAITALMMYSLSGS